MVVKTRIRGDDYPIYIMYKVNGNAIDLTGSILEFSYANANNAVKTIIGTPTEVVGRAEFIPLKGIDFQVAGTFSFDAQRIAGGYTYTHLNGKLILEDDVTKT